MSRIFEVVSDTYRKNEGVSIQLPTRSTRTSVACDFYSPISAVIPPMKSVMIWTDVKAKFAEDEALLLNVRSSMGKQPIMIANTQGWIESDYYSNQDNDGNIGFRLFNLGEDDYTITAGDRIGQGMFVKYLPADNCDSNTKRSGGFGSTGK